MAWLPPVEGGVSGGSAGRGFFPAADTHGRLQASDTVSPATSFRYGHRRCVGCSKEAVPTSDLRRQADAGLASPRTYGNVCPATLPADMP